MTQASRDRHQCVEILQLVEPLGRKINTKVVGVTWQAGGSEDSIPAESIPSSWGVRHVLVWANAGIRQARCVRQGWATTTLCRRYTEVRQVKD